MGDKGIAKRSVSAVLHAHSTWSYDGSWSLARLGRLYTRWGADVVLMTEHDTGFDPARFDAYVAECAAASPPGGCVLVPGVEYSSPDNDIHILTWGLDRFLAEHRPVMETLSQVRSLGGVAVFAHPARRDAWRLFDPSWVPYLNAIEIWNRKTDGLKPGEEALKLWRETGLPATVGMDFHRINQLYPLDNRLDVALHDDTPTARDAAAEAVDAIKRGAIRPRAYGVDLLNDAGLLRPTPQRAHRTFETFRIGARDGLRAIGLRRGRGRRPKNAPDA